MRIENAPYPGRRFNPATIPTPPEDVVRGGRTAIARFKPSLPMLNLQKLGLLRGRKLDYGAGRGFDADYFRMEKFDPNHWPQMPEGAFDTITVNYVLNVLPKEPWEERVLRDVQSRLAPGGRAYITVRRDIKREGMTSKGTFQRNVFLPLPVVTEKKGAYATYVLAPWTSA